MTKLDNYTAKAATGLRQAGQILYRVLDGLARLGIIPWELLHLAVFCTDSVLNLAAVFWIGARKTRAALGGSFRALSQRAIPRRGRVYSGLMRAFS
jgi:hypothetical protein